jgi:hypothetical protein
MNENIEENKAYYIKQAAGSRQKILISGPC